MATFGDNLKQFWDSLDFWQYLGGFRLSGDTSTQYGQFGDYIGGFWGTIISVVTLLVVFLTWRSTQRFTYLQSITSVLVEMLKTHDTISDSGDFSFWHRRGTPSVFLREFATVYRVTKKSVPSYEKWSVEDRIDIAYTFVYYGLSVQSRHSLAKYGDLELKMVQDALSRLRSRTRGRYGDMFKGHQATLSHYIRNLFGMYSLIDQSSLSENHKYNLSKIVRTKLSNYDQALLSLNIISHLGKEWESNGFVWKYRPFSNLPEKFFGFDAKFNLRKRFPAMIFEFEEIVPDRPTYSTRRIGPYSITKQGRYFYTLRRHRKKK